MQEQLKAFDVQPIQPSKEINFIYPRNPIYCSFEAFELALNVEHAALHLENYHQYIFLVAHLYHADILTNLAAKR